MSDSYVYFVQAGDCIKIGITTNIKARMLAIQNGCPLPIKLIRTVRGGVKREANIHRRFMAIRVRNEWFKDTPELREYIRDMREDTPIKESMRIRGREQCDLPDWFMQILAMRNMDIEQLRTLSSIYPDTIAFWAERDYESPAVSGKLGKALGIHYSILESLRALAYRADPAAVIRAMQSIGVVNVTPPESAE